MRLKTFNLSLGAQIFKACADESRLRILSLIVLNGEMCISDLELILDFTQTKTSRQLGTLKNSGVLRYKKVDQWAYYFINETYYEIIAQLFTFLEKDPLLLKDQEEYRTLYSNNELAVRKLHNKLKIYHLPEL